MTHHCDPLRLYGAEQVPQTRKEAQPATPCPKAEATRQSMFMRLRDRLALSPAQAETLARIKFPCC